VRIISKFHDYYDTAMGHGQDPNIVYMRVPSLVPVKGWKWDNQFVEVLNHGHLGWDLHANLGVIGFCGRCYPVWMDAGLQFDEESLTSSRSMIYSLNLADLIKQVSTTYSEKSATFRQSRKRFMASARYIEETVQKAYDAAEKLSGAEVNDASFSELDCPVFVMVGRNYWKVRNPQDFNGMVIKNPRLATLGFQTIADPFSAFQEIAMYMGSALAKEPIAPDTVGDDKLIAKSKGFDEKSFRTAAPGQKKLNRKRNKEAKRRNE